MTPEGRIEAYLKRRVKETGGEIRKLSWIGRRGAPDRMVWWNRVVWTSRQLLYATNFYPIFVFVEVKRPGEKPTAQQHREHERMRSAGFEVVVVDTEESVNVFVNEIQQRRGGG